MRRIMLCLALLPTSIASNAAEPRNILFIGNSFTQHNDLPAMVSALATEGGVSVSIHKATKGGYTIARHAKDQKTLAVLASRSWDCVILQGHSLEPILGKDRMIAGGRELAARTGNARLCVFVTWAYETESRFKKKAAAFKGGGSGDGDTRRIYSNMQKLLNEGYGELARAIEAEVVPVGAAWEAARKRHPDLKLFAKDEYHPSKTGSYLTALVFYKTLFGKSPKKAATRWVDQVTHDKMMALIDAMPPVDAKKGAR